jgi:hypothetical protein
MGEVYRARDRKFGRRQRRRERSPARQASRPSVLQPARSRARRLVRQRSERFPAHLIYWLMVIPAWYARELIGGATGRSLFYLTLAAVIPTSILRLHLWFTLRTNPAELPMQLRREYMWIAGGDALFVIALAWSGLFVGDARMALAVLLMCVGLGSGIIALFVEPATTRGAFSSA